MSFRAGNRGRWRRGDATAAPAAAAESPAYNTPTNSYPTRNNAANNYQAGGTPRSNAAATEDTKPEPFTRRAPFLQEDDPNNDDPMNGSTIADDDANLPPWKKRDMKKLPKKIRKKRLNAKLRNLLVPKNAMMVLNEMHHDLSCVTTETTTPTGQLCFVVTIEIDGKQYRGQGQSKAAAKQTACENALKSTLLEKLGKPPVLTPKEEPEANNATEPALHRGPPEDDTPWGSLASYALYKLFSEWQSQGYMLPPCSGPLPKPTVPAGAMMPMKKMPDDAATRNPVQLLNQLRPGVNYVENREGQPPNLKFTIDVTIDGTVYAGTGSNKKEAKRECAKNALKAMGVVYVDE